MGQKTDRRPEWISATEAARRLGIELPTLLQEHKPKLAETAWRKLGRCVQIEWSAIRGVYLESVRRQALRDGDSDELKRRKTEVQIRREELHVERQALELEKQRRRLLPVDELEPLLTLLETAAVSLAERLGGSQEAVAAIEEYRQRIRAAAGMRSGEAE